MQARNPPRTSKKDSPPLSLLLGTAPCFGASGQPSFYAHLRAWRRASTGARTRTEVPPGPGGYAPACQPHAPQGRVFARPALLRPSRSAPGAPTGPGPRWGAALSGSRPRALRPRPLRTCPLPSRGGGTAGPRVRSGAGSGAEPGGRCRRQGRSPRAVRGGGGAAWEGAGREGPASAGRLCAACPGVSGVPLGAGEAAERWAALS